MAATIAALAARTAGAANVGSRTGVVCPVASLNRQQAWSHASPAASCASTAFPSGFGLARDWQQAAVSHLPTSSLGSATLRECRTRSTTKRQVTVCSVAVSSDVATLNEFFCSDADGSDPDTPSPGFDPVADAIADISRGKLVIVVETDLAVGMKGSLVVAASKASSESLAFMVRYTSGLVCVSLPPQRLMELEIPPMLHDGIDAHTAVAVSVDLKVGTSTGISAADRTKTIQALAAKGTDGNDFRRPGHIFPLRCDPRGVLGKPATEEAAMDLSSLAGLEAASALSVLVNDDDGSLMSLPQIQAFAEEHDVTVISIDDLMRYRKKRQLLVTRTAQARLPTQFGEFEIYSYISTLDGIEHVAMVHGDIGDGMNVLVRVHSECLTGDIFASRRCDCGPQLHRAMEKVVAEGRGVIIYLRGHEGRGIGLGRKLKAYNLQDEGRDTVEANLDLGLPADAREYGVGAQMLKDLGVNSIRLLTNNPSKFRGLKGYGLAVISRSPIVTDVHNDNRRYIETKREKMGHIYGEGGFVPTEEV